MKAPREKFSLRENEVQAWVFDLDNDDLRSIPWEHFLDEDEIVRSRRYKSPVDQWNFIARRGILKILLNRYSSVAISQIRYVLNPNGKPFLPDQPISFNTSKSNSRAAMVFGIEIPLGIDIEQMLPMDDLALMTAYWFSREEIDQLSELNNIDPLIAFYHVWAQKEAYLKAQGEGLSVSPQSVSVSVNPALSELLRDAEGCDARYWKMAGFEVDESYRLAVCAGSNCQPVITLNMVQSGDVVSALISEFY